MLYHGGTRVSDILRSLSYDERCGAKTETYKRGEFIVYPNLYKVGHSLKKRRLNRFTRWLASKGIWFGAWAMQANYVDGSCMSTNSWCRWSAIREAKKWIDEKLDGDGVHT